MTKSLTRHGGRTVLSTLWLIGALALNAVAMAYTGEKLAIMAKISIQTPRDIALKARAGKITDEELEQEKGGSGLRYSFDIREGARTY